MVATKSEEGEDGRWLKEGEHLSMAVSSAQQMQKAFYLVD